MKYLFVLSVALVLFVPRLRCSEGRTITETGATGSTNVYAVNIDGRDIDVIRFYLRSNVFEIRAEEILQRDRTILPTTPPPAIENQRRQLILQIQSYTNAVDFTPANIPTVVSNLTRLRQLEDKIAIPALR